MAAKSSALLTYITPLPPVLLVSGKARLCGVYLTERMAPVHCNILLWQTACVPVYVHIRAGVLLTQHEEAEGWKITQNADKR